MSIQVDVWMRGDDVATTQTIGDLPHPPSQWSDEDVRQLLEDMLRAMHRAKHPTQTSTPVTLRGLSWIVNPYDEGGVVIAIEITLGAAVAGPFDIDKTALDVMIARVLRQRATPLSPTIH